MAHKALEASSGFRWSHNRFKKWIMRYRRLGSNTINDSRVICTLLFLKMVLHFGIRCISTLYLGHLFTVMECTREGNISVKVYPFMEIGTYVLSCPLLLPLSPFIGSNTAVTSITWGCVCACLGLRVERGSGRVFSLRCGQSGRSLSLKVYKSSLLPFWINIKQRLLKQNRVECVQNLSVW